MPADSSAEPSHRPGRVGSPPGRPHDAAIALGVALYALAGLVLVVWPLDATGPRGEPWPWLSGVLAAMYDDGFYYLEIARNLAAGAGSTFDGVTPTNGYHPLWLLVLVPGFKATADEGVALATAVAWQVACHVASVVLIFLTARKFVGRPAAVAAALTWTLVQLTYRMPVSGMEYGVHALTITAIGCAWSRRHDRIDLSVCLWLGSLVSLAFLARIEAVALAATLGWPLARALRAAAPARWIHGLAIFAAPIAAVVAVYAALNWIWFESPVPVSGLMKRSESARLLAEDPVFLGSGWLAAKAWYLTWPLRRLSPAYAWPLLAGTLGAALLAPLVIRLPRERALVRAATPFIAFGLVQYVGMAVLFHGGYGFSPWYFVAPFWVAAMMAAALVDRIVTDTGGAGVRGSGSPWRVALAWALVAALAAQTGRQIGAWRTGQEPSHDPILAAAHWARRALPADAVIGAWNAGAIAYLSGRRVVNLDGAVNSVAYLRDGRLDPCSYWRSAGLTHLVDVFDHRGGRLLVPPYDDRQPDVDACGLRFDLLWTGPSYPGTSRRAESYRLVREAR